MYDRASDERRPMRNDEEKSIKTYYRRIVSRRAKVARREHELAFRLSNR